MNGYIQSLENLYLFTHLDLLIMHSAVQSSKNHRGIDCINNDHPMREGAFRFIVKKGK